MQNKLLIILMLCFITSITRAEESATSITCGEEIRTFTFKDFSPEERPMVSESVLQNTCMLDKRRMALPHVFQAIIDTAMIDGEFHHPVEPYVALTIIVDDQTVTVIQSDKSPTSAYGVWADSLIRHLQYGIYTECFGMDLSHAMVNIHRLIEKDYFLSALVKQLQIYIGFEPTISYGPIRAFEEINNWYISRKSNSTP